MPSGSSFQALAAVAGSLRCPNCGAPLGAAGQALVCGAGHSFDVARHGHVSLLPPAGSVAPGDPAAMVAARVAFLGAGHYGPIARAVVEAARRAHAGPALVADLGAGTGHYLAALLDALPDAHGVALDASRPALRHAVRAHPRIAAVVCDVWREIPLQSGSADLVVDVFSPRNAAEIARVLSPRGAALVVTPGPAHLREVLDHVAAVRVDPRKDLRLDALSPHLERERRAEVEFELALDRAAAEALIAMGPSAHHLSAAAIAAAAAALPDPVRTTAAVRVDVYRPAG